MAMGVITIVIFILASACVYLLWQKKLVTNAPPGPRPLPIVGNLLDLAKSPMHITLKKWSTQYKSSTIGYYVGNRLIVTMHDIHTVRKVFNRDDTTGRDQTSAIPAATRGLGLIFSQGDLWKTTRRFTASTLREFGMGKSWLDDTIKAEVDDMCQILLDTNGGPINPRSIISHSAANVMSALVLGRRFPHSDERFKTLTERITEGLQRSDNTSHVMFPFLKYIPGYFKEDHRIMQRFFADIREFVTDLIRGHSRSFRPDNIKDYIDAYLKEVTLYDNDRLPPSFNRDDQLIWTVFNLLNAGTDTSATTVLWTLAFMLENPEVLRNIQKEMDENILSDVALDASHNVMLPLLEAAIMEVHRMCNLIPLGIFHTALSDLQIDGYDVPKGSSLQVNAYSIHYDPRYWKDPEVFNPSRFLDSTGKVFKPEAFIPFGTGKRACIGEALAKAELLLFVGNILRRFNFRLPDGATISHKEADGVFVLSPKPFEVIFTPRIH